MFGCGTFGAEIRWCDGDRLGLKFDRPFDLRKLGPSPTSVRRNIGLQPDYLSTELDTDSPWAARTTRLSATDLRRLG